MAGYPSADRALALLGYAVLVLGIVLPWVGETQFRVYVLGMESGLERPWGRPLVALAALGEVVTLAEPTIPHARTVAGPLQAATGVIAVSVAVFASPLTGNWPTAIGVYVTIVGGLLVTSAPFVGRFESRSDECQLDS